MYRSRVFGVAAASSSTLRIPWRVVRPHTAAVNDRRVNRGRSSAQDDRTGEAWMELEGSVTVAALAVADTAGGGTGPGDSGAAFGSS
jgi:hypothetical protein